ncbi:hypothetical protein D039_0481A, partial [Vibrio parahaemolyticus EKP-028]
MNNKYRTHYSFRF